MLDYLGMFTIWHSESVGQTCSHVAHPTYYQPAALRLPSLNMVHLNSFASQWTHTTIPYDLSDDLSDLRSWNGSPGVPGHACPWGQGAPWRAGGAIGKYCSEWNIFRMALELLRVHPAPTSVLVWSIRTGKRRAKRVLQTDINKHLKTTIEGKDWSPGKSV